MQFVTLQECNLSHFRNATKISKTCVHLRKFIVLSAVAALAVSLLPQQNGDGSEKELGGWHENGREDRERKCRGNAVKSALRMMSTRESSTPSVANKACGRLYLHVLCGAKPRSHPQNSINVVGTLCPPHTFHTSLHMHGLTVSKARVTPTN